MLLSDLICQKLVSLLYIFSGAIDLAAKTAGIIPGSACPELNSSPVENSALLNTTPIIETQPDSLLLQDNVTEVRYKQKVLLKLLHCEESH